MPYSMESILVTYIGPNAAHRDFRAGLANAKALAYILASGDGGVLHDFLAKAKEAQDGAPDGNYAIGLGGRTTSSTIQLAVHLTGNEITAISGEPGGFQAQVFGLVYREVYRVFESYVLDLFEEVAVIDPSVLGPAPLPEETLATTTGQAALRARVDKKKSELCHAGFGGIEKFYGDLRLPIVPNTSPPSAEELASIRQKLVTLSATRNIIEHRRSIVDTKFLQLVPASPFKLGDRVVVASADLGDALWPVEFTADSLNKRALERFAIPH